MQPITVERPATAAHLINAALNHERERYIQAARAGRVTNWPEAIPAADAADLLVTLSIVLRHIRLPAEVRIASALGLIDAAINDAADAVVPDETPRARGGVLIMSRLIVVLRRALAWFRVRSLEIHLNAVEDELAEAVDAYARASILAHRDIARRDLAAARADYIALLPPGVRRTWRTA